MESGVTRPGRPRLPCRTGVFIRLHESSSGSMKESSPRLHEPATETAPSRDFIAAMMPNQRPRPASLADDLPRWRARLERIWRLQVEEIIELSLAYHDAASAPCPGGMPEPGGSPGSGLREVLSRTAQAHHVLAEIEAALGRIDAASYGLCEQCGLRLDAGWLEACPQVRYCRGCRPRERGRRWSAAAG